MVGPYEYIRYEDPADVFRAYDDRYSVVARSIGDLIGARAPDVRVEPIGSTAVPGCDGNGVLDMMLHNAPGGIGPARDTHLAFSANSADRTRSLKSGQRVSGHSSTMA